MNIAIGSVFDEFGGVSQHIAGIEKHSTHTVTVVPSTLARRILRRTGGIWLYKKWMQRIGLNGYDVLHSHSDPWFTRLCFLSGKRSHSRWVHTYHTYYFEEDWPGGLDWWQRLINASLLEFGSQADLKISVSEWLSDDLSRTYGIETEHVPNGIDLDICAEANPERFQQKYGLRDFVLFVGNIHPIKNPHHFVLLAARFPEIQFVMIGRCLDESHLHEQYRLEIPKNLVLMNEMGHEDVLDALSACLLFVMTSKREGFPTVLLEAMAMGKPCVAPNTHGCKEIIESSQYGFLYEPGSCEDLVEKTRGGLASNTAGENARKHVEQKYDWRVIIKKIDSIYESLG